MPFVVFRDAMLIMWCVTLFLDKDWAWLRWWCCGTVTTLSLIGLGWVK